MFPYKYPKVYGLKVSYLKRIIGVEENGICHRKHIYTKLFDIFLKYSWITGIQFSERWKKLAHKVYNQ